MTTLCKPQFRHRVTIGLPVYNGEMFIRQTLDSLCAQTFSDFEIIVSDNASIDHTVEIVQDYAAHEPRIRLVQNQRNFGATYNFNRVLDLAHGEYFKWMAADDVISPEFLAQSVAVLDANPNVVLVYAQAAFIDERDRILYRFDDTMALRPWSAHVVARTNQVLQAIFMDGSAANVFIFGLARTRTLRAIRPFGNYFGCDFTVMTELAMFGEIYELPTIMAFYRRHQGSISTYKRPSAARQQQFLDPTVTNPLRQELQLRRRYVEVWHSIARANLSIGQKIAIALFALRCIIRRTGWRMGYEIREALRRPPNQRATESADIGNLHRHKETPEK